jgi:hypothetical protein
MKQQTVDVPSQGLHRVAANEAVAHGHQICQQSFLVDVPSQRLHRIAAKEAVAHGHQI